MTSKDPDIPLSDPRFNITPVQQLAASTTGGLTTALIMTPLDVVKIRLQMQTNMKSHFQFSRSISFFYSNGLMDHLCPIDAGEKYWYNRPVPVPPYTIGTPKFTGTFDAMVKIARYEGISSLWSGLSATIVLALPAVVIYFSTYEQLRQKLVNKFSEDGTATPIWVSMFSGATARVGSVTFVSPIELMRTKKQAQKLSWNEVFTTVKRLVKTDGVRGLWKGLTPTLLRDVPFSGMYWGLYETMKANLPEKDQGKFLPSMMSGVVAGAFAAFATTPFDVAKTHYQVSLAKEIFKEPTIERDRIHREIQKVCDHCGKITIHQGNVEYSSKGPAVKPQPSLFATLKNIFKTNGIRGIFAGLTPRVMKVAPACGIMVSTYEYSKSYFQSYNFEKYQNRKKET